MTRNLRGSAIIGLAGVHSRSRTAWTCKCAALQVANELKRVSNTCSAPVAPNGAVNYRVGLFVRVPERIGSSTYQSTRSALDDSVLRADHMRTLTNWATPLKS